MKTEFLLQLSTTFASLSLMAVGGAVAVLPELHRQVVDTHHWMSDSTFAQLFAIAQAAPGPNMMMVSLIGYRLAGWSGLLVSTFGFLLPAGCLAAYAGKLIDRYEENWQLAALKSGLAPVALGLYAAGGGALCQVADRDAAGIGLSLLGIVFILKTNWNPLWVLGAGALAGVLLHG